MPCDVQFSAADIAKIWHLNAENVWVSDIAKKAQLNTEKKIHRNAKMQLQKNILADHDKHLSDKIQRCWKQFHPTGTVAFPIAKSTIYHRIKWKKFQKYSKVCLKYVKIAS